MNNNRCHHTLSNGQAYDEHDLRRPIYSVGDRVRRSSHQAMGPYIVKAVNYDFTFMYLLDEEATGQEYGVVEEENLKPA